MDGEWNEEVLERVRRGADEVEQVLRKALDRAKERPSTYTRDEQPPGQSSSDEDGTDEVTETVQRELLRHATPFNVTVSFTIANPYLDDEREMLKIETEVRRRAGDEFVRQLDAARKARARG